MPKIELPKIEVPKLALTSLDLPDVPVPAAVARPVYATQVAVDDVVARLASPAGRDELGGTEVDPTVVTTLRRRAGGGRALDQTGAALGSAMGLETEIRKLRAKGLRPLLLGACAWLFIGAFTFTLIKLTGA